MKVNKKALCYDWYQWDIWAYSRESHIINYTRNQQQSVTITLIDLENTFGEVHHSLNQTILYYHTLPDEINCTVKLLSSDFRLLIITNNFCTKWTAVEKGLIQGDSISPLINLIINNFVQYAKEEKPTNFRYCTFRGSFPLNWFHSVVVTFIVIF